MNDFLKSQAALNIADAACLSALANNRKDLFLVVHAEYEQAKWEFIREFKKLRNDASRIYIEIGRD